MKQAKLAREKFKNEEFDLMITSPLKKAMHTAEIKK